MHIIIRDVRIKENNKKYDLIIALGFVLMKYCNDYQIDYGEEDDIALKDVTEWADGIMGALGTEYADRVTNKETEIAFKITKTK